MCSCCGLFDDAASAVGIGDKHARESLFEAIGKLRNTLSRVLGTPLADVMELQYLRYPGGGKGFYGRHVDQQVRDRGKANRIYSILLYLNDLEWDSVVDGGSLMAYPSGKEPVEVEPVGGTLVLFDSRKLEHEARPTMRERWALVGWFLEGPQLINLDSQPHKKQRTAK
jgi:SM-20-related protein